MHCRSRLHANPLDPAPGSGLGLAVPRRTLYLIFSARGRFIDAHSSVNLMKTEINSAKLAELSRGNRIWVCVCLKTTGGRAGGTKPCTQPWRTLQLIQKRVKGGRLQFRPATRPQRLSPGSPSACFAQPRNFAPRLNNNESRVIASAGHASLRPPQNVQRGDWAMRRILKG